MKLVGAEDYLDLHGFLEEFYREIVNIGRNPFGEEKAAEKGDSLVRFT